MNEDSKRRLQHLAGVGQILAESKQLNEMPRVTDEHAAKIREVYRIASESIEEARHVRDGGPVEWEDVAHQLLADMELIQQTLDR